MARTLSNMLALGTTIPSFQLLDTTTGETTPSNELVGSKGTIVMFICNHCPFVIHLHQGIQQLVKEFSSDELRFIAISSNDIEHYPQDDPNEMTKLFRTLDLAIPYLYDEAQEVAKQFEAACTPDFYLFDENQALTYRGQFDDSRPGNNIAVTGKDLSAAIQNLLENKGPLDTQIPSLGCNIKWK